jgi:hypothetical protein
MNIVQLEDDIKSLPDDRLMTEMQAPTGGFPQYLVLSEIKRRKQMRDDYKGRMAAHEKTPPRPTIAEETVQEGISSIMPSNMSQGAPPQGMPMAQGMPVNQPASIEGGGLESLMPQGQGMPQGMPMRMEGGGRTNRVMLGKTNYQDATFNPQGSGFFGLEGFDPSLYGQTEAEKAYQEMMLDYYSPERRKERDKFSKGMNMLRAGLAVGTARTPEQLSASMGPVIEGAIAGRAAGEKEDLALAGAQAQMSKLERDRQLKLAELGIRSKQAEDLGNYYGKQSAWAERTDAVLGLAGSQAPLDKGIGVHTSDNNFVQWEIVPETKDGNPVLDSKGKPKLIAKNPTLTGDGIDKVGRLAQQGTYESAVMRTQQDLRELASENVRKDKDFQSKLNAPKIIKQKAQTIFKVEEPTQEQLREAKDLLRDFEIEREIDRLRNEGRFQSGGRIDSPPVVGLPSIQQMME